MIYGTQDGWFPLPPGPGPVLLAAYILVHVSTTVYVMCIHYIHNQLIFGISICKYLSNNFPLTTFKIIIIYILPTFSTFILNIT